MKYYFDIEQGTEEWRQVRAGKVTGSVVKTLFVKGEAVHGFGAGAISAARKIAEERVTKIPRENYSNKAADWGHEYEPMAADYYQEIMFQNVTIVGFVERDDFTGSSPDRLIGKMGGLEIKCLPVEHVAIIDGGTYRKSEYIQCQYNLWVTGREWWDLLYFHPNLPKKSKSLIFRIKPDKEMHEEFEKKIKLFKPVVEGIIKKLA